MYESFEKLASQWARTQNISGFEFRITAEWASNQHRYRELIREELGQLTQGDFADLSIRPICSTHSISISHCPLAGGFILAAKSESAPGDRSDSKTSHRVLGLGFDLEDFRRVAPKVVQRVSTPEEINRAPSPAHLWCAKEAAFKALADFNQPAIMSQLIIGNWARVQVQAQVQPQAQALSNGRGATQVNCEEGQTLHSAWTYQLTGIGDVSQEIANSTNVSSHPTSSGVVLEKNGLIGAFFSLFSQT